GLHRHEGDVEVGAEPLSLVNVERRRPRLEGLVRPGDLEALLADRLDLLGPGVDQGDVVAGPGQETADIAADRACADEKDSWAHARIISGFSTASNSPSKSPRHGYDRRAMAGDVILATEGLTKEFRGFVAVRDVSLRVRRGTIHALIGPNGAGKTTCFNLLTHFLAPTRGRLSFNRPDITGS